MCRGGGCGPVLTPGTSGPKEALRDFLACAACTPSSLHRWKPFFGVPVDCDLAGTRGGGDKGGLECNYLSWVLISLTL